MKTLKCQWDTFLVARDLYESGNYAALSLLLKARVLPLDRRQLCEPLRTIATDVLNDVEAEFRKSSKRRGARRVNDVRRSERRK